MKNNLPFLIMGATLLLALGAFAFFLSRSDLDQPDLTEAVPAQAPAEVAPGATTPDAIAARNASEPTEATGDRQASADTEAESKVDDAARPSGPGVIKGIVTQDDDGSLVSGAKVTLEQFVRPSDSAAKAKRPSPWTVETDEEGRFRVADLPLVSLEGESYGPILVTAVKGGESASIMSILTDDAPTALIELKLRPAGAISGQVHDEAGAPVADALIVAHRTSVESPLEFQHAFAGMALDYSDRDGRFSMENLTLGSWTLVASAENFVEVTTEPFDTGVTNAEIVLTHGATASGTVIDSESGEPAPGVELTIGSGENIQIQHSTTSGEDGSFTANALADGAYWVRVEDETLAPAEAAPRFSIVDAAPVTDIVVRVTKGAAIAGTVRDITTDQPVGGISLHAFNPDGMGRPQEGKSGDDGKYLLSGLTEGLYAISVTARDDYVELDGQNYRTVSVKLGETTDQIDFGVRPGVSLSGNVRNEEGEAVEGIGVHTSTMSEYYRTISSVTTDENGAFEIRGVMPQIQVTLGASGRGYAAPKVGPLDTGESGLDGIEIVVGAGGSIAGVVVTPSGKPVPNAMVTVDSEEHWLDEPVMTDAEGAFTLANLAAGTYQLYAHEMSTMESGLEDKQDVNVARGQAVKGIRLVLGKAPESTISGTVTNVKGEPIKGAYINANTMMGEGHGYAESGADGTYEVAVDEGNTYRLDVAHDSYSSQEREEVAAGERNVDIVLEGLGIVEGQVLDAVTGKPIPRFEVAHTSGLSDSYDFQFLGYIAFYNEDGQFRIDDVEAGEATIHVRATGYGPGSQQIADVQAGEANAGIQFQLQAGASIAGIVLDANGAPIQGARIHLGDSTGFWLMSESLEDAAATSDAEGRFTIDSLGSELAAISATHADYANATVEVALEPGKAVQVEIVMAASGTVEGVVSADGIPVADQTVFVQTDNMADLQMATTDAKGFYSISGIAPGEVTLSASATHDDATRSQDKTATVEAGATTTLNFNIEFGAGAIEGQFLSGGQPVSDGYIAAMPVGAVEGHFASIDGAVSPDGTYRISGLDAGDYKVMAQTGGLGNGPSRTRTLNATVGDGETVHLDIDLEGGSHLRGVITGFSDASVCQVVAFTGKIEISDLESAMASPEMQAGAAGNASVDPSGAYDISGLEPGEYTVLVFQFDLNDLEKSPFATGQVTMGESGAAELNLTLP